MRCSAVAKFTPWNGLRLTCCHAPFMEFRWPQVTSSTVFTSPTCFNFRSQRLGSRLLQLRSWLTLIHPSEYVFQKLAIQVIRSVIPFRAAAFIYMVELYSIRFQSPAFASRVCDFTSKRQVEPSCDRQAAVDGLAQSQLLLAAQHLLLALKLLPPLLPRPQLLKRRLERFQVPALEARRLEKLT